MTNHIEAFLSAMRDHGVEIIDPEHVKDDDKINRLHMEGDKRGEPSVSYRLAVGQDGFAYGWAVPWRMGGERINWHSKPERGKTKEQRAQAKAWHDQQREAAREEQQRVAAENRERIARMWSQSWPCKGHGYLERKGLEPCEGLHVLDDMLLVPAFCEGEMVGFQRIKEDGWKRFIDGTVAGGAWFEIPGDTDTVAIAEGLATGLRIRKLTGWAVRIGFSSGQLAAAAKAAREAYPDARIVVCGDSDQWTFIATKVPLGVKPREVAGDDPRWAEWRSECRLVNPGADAMQAAVKVGAQAALPPIPADHAGKATDWDDYAREWGDDAARSLLLAIPDTRARHVEEWVPEFEDEVGPSWDEVALPIDKLKDQCGPMGFDDEFYFFLPRTKGQVLELTASSLGSMQNLYQLANASEYERIMGWDQLKPAEAVASIGPMLMDICHRIGPYENGRVYGAGAWVVGKKQYINTGSSVYDVAAGVEYQHREVEIDGAFVREAKAFYLDCAPLANKEANKLIQICQMLKWRRPISGTLLAGWLVVAMVGGALRWRPHVFITGPKGAGKSTVIEEIVEVVIGDSMIRQDGGSTEAGLRKEVKNSSRPIVMDEFEGESKRAAEEVGKILFWARKASSGGYIVNANRKYRAKSCVCFAAINPLVTQGADADRITLLELEVNKDKDAEEHFDKLMDLVHDTLTVEYARRLARRTVDNLDALLWNCEVFAKHASRILKSKRDGDQFGPMLAGAYMLHATGLVTDETAAEYCARQDWSWVHDQKDGTDSERLIRRILNSMIEYSMVDRTVKMPVSEMIVRVMRGDPGSGDAAKALARCGMAVKGEWLCVANTDDGLSGLLQGTPWVAYRPSLSRLEGVITEDKTMRFGGGSPRRYMKVPMAGLIDGVVEELPIDGDNGGDWG